MDEKNIIKEIRKQSVCLHTRKSFIANIMHPLKEFIPHNASGITNFRGISCDDTMMFYGYPDGYLLEWGNRPVESNQRWDPYFEDGQAVGCSTLRASDFTPSVKESEECRQLHIKFGLKDGIQTMFFDDMGNFMGVYALNRFEMDEKITDEELNLFNKISSFSFFACNRYRWLSDHDLFSISDFDSTLMGIIVTDKNGIIKDLNGTSRYLLKNKKGRIPSRLTEELFGLTESLKSVAQAKKINPFFFRRLEHITEYGAAVCFKYNGDSNYHGLEGNGYIIFIEPMRLNREMIASFSKREMEAVRCLINGKTDKEIALDMNISTRTVQTYIEKSFQKLGVSNRTEAAIKAFKIGIH